MAADPQFPALPPKNAAVKFVNADGSTLKTLLVAGATGAYLEVIEITSTDTVARDVTLFLSDGTTDYFYDTVAVAAATALVKVVKVNLLDANRRSSLDPNNIRKILGLNWRFKVRVETAVTAGAEVAVLCDYGEF